ncbi:MAG: glycosyltransferase family 39 protein [Pirellulaceae bacterium]
MWHITKKRLRYWWNTIQFPADRQETQTSGMPWTKRQGAMAIGFLIVASLLILVPNLSFPLIEPDETRYAQIAIEMNQSGDWTTPTLNGEPYLDKPPLMYWLTATSLSCFGNTPWAARLPSVLAALATVLAVFVLGRRILGSRAAWLGGMSLLLCAGFAIAGRFLVLDSLLAFLTTLCFLSGYVAVREEQHRWAWWMLAGTACALGVLTKGPIAIVLCVPPLIVNGWLCRDQSRTRLLHWAAFAAPTAILCVPWYVAVWQANPEFGDYFFFRHNFQRFTKGSNHEQAFWFYIPVVFAATFPASLLLPSLGLFLVSPANRKRVLRSKDMGYLFCSTVWILLFFSVASCKLPTYILPAIPLIALMMGGMLEKTVLNPQHFSRITNFLKPFPQRASLIVLAICFLMIAAEVWLHASISVLTIGFAVIALAALFITLAYWNRETAFSMQGWMFTMVVGVLAVSFTTVGFIPTAATDRSVYTRTANLTDQHPDAPIAFLGEEAYGVGIPLAGKQILRFPFQKHDEFVAFVADHPGVIVVSNEKCMHPTTELLSKTHQVTTHDRRQHVFLIEPLRQRQNLDGSTVVGISQSSDESSNLTR